MEQLLHYCWKHKMWPLKGLETTDGRVVEVLDPGLHNRNAGPDFFNAKVKINGTLWVGNVEIHDKSMCLSMFARTMQNCFGRTPILPAIVSFPT